MEETGTKFFKLENFVTNCDHFTDYLTKLHPSWDEAFYIKVPTIVFSFYQSHL